MTKVCTACKIEKDRTEFNARKQLKDGLDSHCRSCTREYMRRWYKNHPDAVLRNQAQVRALRKANPDKFRDSTRRSHAKRRKEKRGILDWLISKYGNIPCMDCNGVFPWCAMDFDHRPEEIKSFGVASLGSRLITSERIAKIEKEIAKCDLVCSNCHRLRTSNRQTYE